MNTSMMSMTMRGMRNMEKIKTYPYIANFDDRIVPQDLTAFYIFSFGKTFGWREITANYPLVKAFGKTFELWDGTVYVDEHKVKDSFTFEKLVVKCYNKMNIHIISPPKGKMIISNAEAAGIRILGESHAVITPKFAKNHDIETYELHLISNGEQCYINGHLIEGFNGEFKVGDKLVISGIHIERRPKQFKVTGIKEDVLLNSKKVQSAPLIPEYPVDFPEYRRSPRILKTAPEDTVKITKPKALEEPAKGALLKTILPPLMMVGMSVMMGLTMGRNLVMVAGMSSMALVTASFTVSAYFSNRKEITEKNAKRDEDYEQYLVSKQAELNRLEEKEREALLHHYPSMETISQMVHDYDPRVYEKTTANADFLEFALGLGTSIPSYKIDFDMGDDPDELTRYTNSVINERQTLIDIPVRARLQGEALGFIGVYSVQKTAVQTLLFQIAAFHSYKDVEFIALVPEDKYDEDFKYWRWLPHFKIQALNLRGLIHSDRSRDMVLNSFYQLITKRKNAISEAGEKQEVKFSPHYVFTILDDSYLIGHGLNEYLAEDMSKYGVTVIWCKESQAMLPETVTTMVAYPNSQAGVLINESNVYVNKKFVPYHMPTKIPVSLAITRLANLDHVEVEKNAIPKVVTFLDMYKVKKVEELDILNRWSKANTAKTLAVPLGLRGKDDLVELNLHERAHGPHGLVAGTTGSGKSEIVQSYVLSLAINFSPEDVGFLPIDFKGGGMVNEFKNLPHLMGAITNLDGAASARALASIQAELKKRQAMFGQYGVNHINGYTKLYNKGKEAPANEKDEYPSRPIPHLFLISDEFAELKANEPEFMAELVSVARIGRSLGVHLILATQKPSGVVDDQIWSNSRFKLALKVANEGDSNEIIKTPDAAHIVEPGRAYLQVGNNEIYELFQSAWSGPDYDPDKTVEEKVDDRVWLINQLGQYELLTLDSDDDDEEVSTSPKDELPTELRAIVDYIDVLAKENNAIIPDKPWLPPLGEQIVTPEIDREEEWIKDRDLKVDIAMMDFPDEQDQRAYIFDLEEDKHTAIYGSAGFGKSTVLQTIVMSLARKNTPEQVQFNLFDFGTNGLLPLKDLPHTVDLARAEDEEKLEKFLSMVQAEVARRKELFTDVSVASLGQYEAKTGEKLPVIVTIVDAYDSIKENQGLSESVDGMLLQLLRDGANVGMYVLATALRSNSFRMNISGNIPTKIALFLNDESELSELVGRERLPIQEMFGRAQIKLDAARSMQFYLPADGEDDFSRLEVLDAEVTAINESWTGARPFGVPMLPKEISVEWFFENREVREWISKGNIPLALSAATTEVRGFRPQVDPYFLIADADMAQTEYINKTLEDVFVQLGDTYNRVVFDVSENYEGRYDLFDEIISKEEISGVMNGIASLVKGEEILEPPAAPKPVVPAKTPKPAASSIEEMKALIRAEFEEADRAAAANEGKEVEETEKVEDETIEEVIEAVAEENPMADIFAEIDAIGETVEAREKEKVEAAEVEAAKQNEGAELETPMIVYVPDLSEVLKQISLSDSDVKVLMKNAKDAGVHLLFHTPVVSMNTFREGLGKYIKEMTRTGFVGQRSADQQFINVKKSYGEPQIADGEHSYFDKKFIERVRTIGVME